MGMETYTKPLALKLREVVVSALAFIVPIAARPMLRACSHAVQESTVGSYSTKLENHSEQVACTASNRRLISDNRLYII